MTLQEIYLQQGAELAQDGIPLHFGNPKSEYTAALESAILLDRSHEGRLLVTGKDRFELLNRMSTNNILTLAENKGKPTIFTNPNARVIDRAEVFNQPGDSLLVLAGPGRRAALGGYLQRNIFFNDEAQIEDISSKTNQFALHGPQAKNVIAAAFPSAAELNEYEMAQVSFGDAQVIIGRLKAVVETHWFLIVDSEQAAGLWMFLLEQGRAYTLLPTGGITFNVLRIRAGVPGVGRELTQEYIPLELGLWDEISFNKGCYTGQEIIARMESRSKLARTIVRLELETFAAASTELFHEGRKVGVITSSVKAPDGELFSIGVVKTSIAEPEVILHTAEGQSARILNLVGIQPLTTST